MSKIQHLTATALTFVMLGALAQDAPLAESSHSTIGYPSPGAALNALRKDSSVVFEEHDGWIVASDAAKRVVWTFAPKKDPAYPAVVKRAIVERNGALMVDMGVLCGASKVVCDDFVRKFLSLNEQVARTIQKRPAEQGASTPGQ
jgi:hypothetical protein